jgi:hypothetical protein
MMKHGILDSSEAPAQAQMLRVDGMEPRLNRLPSHAPVGLNSSTTIDRVFARFLSIRIVELVARYP